MSTLSTMRDIALPPRREECDAPTSCSCASALPMPRLPLLNRARDVRRALLPAGEYPEYDERRTVYFSRENKNYKNQARRPLPLNGLGCIAAAGAARPRVERLSRLNDRYFLCVCAEQAFARECARRARDGPL